MNLVGKIFTFIIFLLCVMFSSMAMMVFSSHQNWKMSTLTQQNLVKEATEKYNTLLAEKNANEEKAKKDHDVEEARIAQFQSAVNDLTPRLAASEKLNVEKDDRIRSLAAAAKNAHATLDSLRADAEKLRGDIKEARAERDQRYTQLVKATDDLHNTIGERDRLSKQNLTLAGQVAKDNECFQYIKVNPNSDYKAKEPPRDLEGEVTSASRQDAIEISIGSDDGLRKGHKLEVVRISTHSYVGRIEVVEVSPNRAVCRPDQSMQRSAIQKGDHVYASLSKFK